jgi:hypothetical protein
MTNDDRKRRQRLLAFLSKGQATVRPAASAGRVLLDGGERGVLGEDVLVLSQLVKEGLVARVGGSVGLAETGSHALKRGEAGTDGLSAQPQERRTETINTDAGRESVVVNDAESPLMLLWRRRDRSGRHFLSEQEFRAGERLRMDYTRGRILPRLGINWSSIGGGAGHGTGAANGVTDLSDTSLAARQRVENAISAVGPELSGVLIDVCCFLKGLERVEAERGWPARSAKVVLKSALGALARYYEPPPRNSHALKTMLHWGSADYRPAMR